MLEGVDAGRSFRYSASGPFALRARSDPDDDGLALRTDPSDALHAVLARIEGVWTIEHRRGAALVVDGAERPSARIGRGTRIRLGSTALEAMLVAPRTAPASFGADQPEGAPNGAGFEVLEPVAWGGQARTYLARRLSDGALVAWKVGHARAGEAMKRDFRREAEIAGRLANHPHVAELLGSDLAAKEPWLAFRWVVGESLEARVRRDGPLSVADACLVATQVLGVLDVIHAAGFVHRDIHPGNLLLADRPESVRLHAVLIDFGLGKALRSEDVAETRNPTRTGEWMGRPRFLAPEQADDGKRVGPPADLYGVAASLYWALCRQPVLREDSGDSPLAAWARGHRVPIRRRTRDVPESLAIALDAVLDRDPDVRWAGGEAFRAEIRRWGGHVGT